MRLIVAILALAIFAVSGCIQPQSGPKASEQVASEKWIPDGVVGEKEYAKSIVLEEASGYGYSGGRLELSWKNDADFIYMALKGYTHGWISIGFEPTEWMKDADIIMGSVNGKNTTLLDEYSTGNYGPHLNDTVLGGNYDVQESGGKDEGNYTVIEFKRKMNTGDKFDKSFSPGENISIIWAMADTKNSDVKHNIAMGEGVLSLEK